MAKKQKFVNKASLLCWNWFFLR
ncbi:ribosomal protein subunit L39 [Schizosaccharomyces octosporus yFS286]|uniref:Ribosomal protein subunit L39 n=1 Tax=Schizosaccharomyces octosporus (strain yFS286) TaxID=483514 RepID=S9R746_SCHOY|nr:ribosomal protein subunit L39 [Schizosaccharomyces octosporus yFS286]EPX74060.1 ribosomal protein subunit L39 [Schizosaccharomyces octosporus yFS286]